MRKRNIGFRYRTNKVKLDDRTWRTQWMFTKDIQPPDVREVLAKYKVKDKDRLHDEYCIGFFDENKFYAKLDPEADDERDGEIEDEYIEVDILPDCWVSIDAVEELLTYLWDKMKQEEWFSANCNLPEDDEVVLCYDKTCGYFVATYLYGGLWKLRDGSVFKRGLDYPQKPDYWARLQKPEEEDSNKVETKTTENKTAKDKGNYSGWVKDTKTKTAEKDEGNNGWFKIGDVEPRDRELIAIFDGENDYNLGWFDESSGEVFLPDDGLAEDPYSLWWKRLGKPKQENDKDK